MIPRAALRGSTLIAAFGFVLLVGAGIGVVAANPDLGDFFFTLFAEKTTHVDPTLPPHLLAKAIFANNLLVAAALTAGGLTLGLATAWLLLINALLIGALLEHVRQEHGLLVVAAGILPHGIFEIPALLIAAALGFQLGGWLLRALSGRMPGGRPAVAEFATYGLRQTRWFLVLVVPLLAVAAVIEAYLTPAIILLAL